MIKERLEQLKKSVSDEQFQFKVEQLLEEIESIGPFIDDELLAEYEGLPLVSTALLLLRAEYNRVLSKSVGDAYEIAARYYLERALQVTTCITSLCYIVRSKLNNRGKCLDDKVCAVKDALVAYEQPNKPNAISYVKTLLMYASRDNVQEAISCYLPGFKERANRTLAEIKKEEDRQQEEIVEYGRPSI